MARVRHVALLIESSREYGRGVLRGVAKYVRAHRQWSVYLQPRSPEDPPPPWLKTWEGDGIIARVEDRAMERAIQEKGLPVVDVRGVLDMAIPLVETNDRSVAQLAFDHLAERGFRRFAFFGLEGANYAERRLRYFQPLVEAAGATCHVYRSPESRKASGLSTREQAALLFEDRMLEWLRGLPRPIGIMACNDVCGQQVLNACRELGIAVPEALAVVGVDNDEIHCELSDPSLSSVAPDTERIGYRAAELLDLLMDGRGAPTGKTFVEPLGVVARQSTDVLAIEDEDVAAAVRFIRGHACEGIGVPDILAHVPIGRRVLERRFRRWLGRSPNEEILRIRIARAQDLLAGTDLPIATIAARAGFKHAEYLSAVFRKTLGRSPSEFRTLEPRRPH